MSYRIDYSPSFSPAPRKHTGRLIALTGLCFFLFLLGVGRFWPAGSAALDRMLMPGTLCSAGDPPGLFARLQTGVSLPEAVTGLCRDLMGLEDAAF